MTLFFRGSAFVGAMIREVTMTALDGNTQVAFTYGNTQVVSTVKALLVGIGTLLLASGIILWAVLSFAIAGMRADLSAIRQEIESLQAADRESINRSNDVNMKLAEQLTGINKSVNDVAVRVSDMQKPLPVSAPRR
jgi:hypothetical protein